LFARAPFPLRQRHVQEAGIGVKKPVTLEPAWATRL
jgi:hypothetical protein